ncbi:MAG: hypothetical protein D6705_00140 [Deltaproteobacteria bacterium]|nr:MAG: hypothetical protein D6705_00140 [Deltaproteobacteria bacterium]
MPAMACTITRSVILARWTLVSLLVVAGCGGGGRSDADTSASATITATGTATATDGTGGVTTGAGPTSGTDSGGATTVKFDVGEGESDSSGETAGDCPPVTGDALLTGTVYAPNQEIPVSGALVYAGTTPPDPIPQTVYCAECVELPCGTAHTLTNPDGSFSLEVPSGTKYVAVQKGQFLRVVELDVQPGENPLGPDVTSLPDHNDPANGLYIPKIAVAYGSYDRLEDGLAKLGLGQTNVDNANYEETLVGGTEQFDLWDNEGDIFGPPAGISFKGPFAQLLSNYALMEQYHIIFVPCSNDTALSALDDPAVVDNVRKWVEAGGKFYVSDWSNEFIEKVFPQYQEFWTDEFGDTDLFSVYDSLATVLDPDLLAWLEALPADLKDINPKNGGNAGHPTVNNLPTIELVDNWSGVKEIFEILVPDGMGGMVNVGHKVWVEGPGDGDVIPTNTNWPMTITGQYGCGKLMFTTYHTAESGAYIGLTPQELVLMYLILEIGVCQTPYEPPPPQG